jgi:predicted butyrate kinase (DUF1464 family)
MSGVRRGIGIDPGTKSFGICGLEGDRLFLDRSIPTADVSANPQALVDLLQASDRPAMDCPGLQPGTWGHGKWTFSS